jgi:hypothetical protein
MQLTTARNSTPRPHRLGHERADSANTAIPRVHVKLFPQRPDGPVFVAEYRAALRRNTDGSIDFDFYRKYAATLRRQAKRQHVTLMVVYAGLLAFGLGMAIFKASTKPIVAPSGGVAATEISIKPQQGEMK